MMTQLQDESFMKNLERLYSDHVEGDSLQRFRTKAWDHFQELGLPQKTDEPFRYLNLKSLFERELAASYPTECVFKDFSKFIFKECCLSVIVFVNGFFRPELSNLEAISEQIVVSPLSRATRTYGAFLNSHWNKSLQEEIDPFAALNAAMQKDGVFIYAPPGVQAKAPVQILHLIDAQDQSMLIQPRVQIFLSTEAEVEFHAVNAHLSGSNYTINGVIDAAFEASSKSKLTLSSFNLEESCWNFEAVRASLKRDADFTSYAVNSSEATIRHDYKVALTQDNASAAIDGVSFLDKSAKAHVHVLVDHHGAYTRSRQLFKNVLKDFSKSSFEGKILVRKPADKTDAFQLNNNLLLSERAHADSKPNLEIFSPDVKASHGATVGRLNEEELFYLESRGLPEELAKNILVSAFLKEVVDLVPLDSLRGILSETAENYI